jgi:hypothetical protein
VINAAGMFLSSGSGSGESSGDKGSCRAADSLDCAMRVLKALTAPFPSWSCPCAANNHLLSTVKCSVADRPSQAMVTAININKHNTFSLMPLTATHSLAHRAGESVQVWQSLCLG